VSRPGSVSADAARSLAGRAVAVRWQDLTQEARSAAAVFLLDALSVGVSGSKEPAADAVVRVAQGWGSDHSCAVLGRKTRLPPASAAYVNAFQVHCQEFDCLHEPATVHAMAVLTGALLAYAEPRDLPLEQLLLATVVGVEVAVTLGLCASEGLRFFRPATAGLMGATAALACLEGFDEPRFLDAWGLGYSQLAGTMQAHVEGSVALPLQVAAAARAALNAIELTRAGLAGPHAVLDGPFGYFTLFERAPDRTPLQSAFAEPWHVTALSHKPFPTGRAAHASLQALAGLMDENELRADDIETVTAQVPPLIRRLVERPYEPGLGANRARLCLPYLVAVHLRNGRVDSDCFSERWLNDASLAPLAARVHLEDNGTSDPNALSPQRLLLKLNNGRELMMDVPHTLGSPGCPLDRSQRLDKARRCLEFAGLQRSSADKLAVQLELAATGVLAPSEAGDAPPLRKTTDLLALLSSGALAN
jgi:2-methylcitrate dehydratase PrpD